MSDLYDYPEIYDERFTDRAHQAYKQHYQKVLEGKNIRSVLDCSIGTGCLTFPLVELGYSVWGSDISGSMLGRAAEKAKDKGWEVELVRCDFRELASHFPRQFDCVMSTGNALAHVSNAEVLHTLHEMDKCIRTGGCLYYDSRNWEKCLREAAKFQVGQPFYRADGVRIGYVQDWEYLPDGTVTIHILQSYERDGRIFDTKEFQEHLHPFPLGPVKAELEKMGYSPITVAPCPWLEDRDFAETGWYCLLAQKN